MVFAIFMLKVTVQIYYRFANLDSDQFFVTCRASIYQISEPANSQKPRFEVIKPLIANHEKNIRCPPLVFAKVTNAYRSDLLKHPGAEYLKLGPLKYKDTMSNTPLRFSVEEVGKGGDTPVTARQQYTSRQTDKRHMVSCPHKVPLTPPPRRAPTYRVVCAAV